MSKYGLGEPRLPEIGTTTADHKVGIIEGGFFQAGNQLSEGVTARLLRSEERRGLRPDEKLIQERQSAIAHKFDKVEFPMAGVSRIESEEQFQRKIEGRDVGKTFSPEEANAYNKDIKKTYKSPQSQAQLDWDRENERKRGIRNRQLLRIQDGFLPKTAAMLGGFGGAMADPSNLALFLLPGAVEIKGAMGISRLGRLGVKTTDFAFGAAEGVVTDLAFEVPNFIMAKGLQEEYSVQSLMFSTLASGTLSGAFQVPMGVWGRALDAERLVKNPTDIDALIPPTNEVSTQLNRLAKWEMEDSVEVRSLVDAAIGASEEVRQTKGLTPLAPGIHDHARGTLKATSRAQKAAPGVGRKQFLAQMQNGLDTDLYFLTRNLDLVAQRSDLDERFSIQRFVDKEGRRKTKLSKAEGRKTKQKELALDKLVRKTNRELEPITSEEIFAGFEDAGIRLGVDTPDELDFTPRGNQAKDIELTSSRAFETSRELDTVGARMGVPEVKNLDRTKHLMKDFQMRLSASRIALGNALDGKPVRVDFLMRKAVATDMNSRGLTSRLEYQEMMEDIAKAEGEFYERGSAGLLADPATPIRSDAQVAEGNLPQEGETALFTREAQEIEEAVQGEVEGLDFNFEELEQYRKNVDALEEIKEVETQFSGEGITKAMRLLASCMAGGRK